MKAGGNSAAKSPAKKNPREGPSFEIPMLTQKTCPRSSRSDEVPMQHHCKKYPSNLKAFQNHVLYTILFNNSHQSSLRLTI